MVKGIFGNVKKGIQS